MDRTIKVILVSLGLLVIFAIILVNLTGCSSPPEIIKDKDGNIIESMACYQARYCDYANKDNKDKCIDQWKECRARARYEDCREEAYRWKGQDCQSCWDKLNSK
jgi:hypothetical protein